MRAVQSKTDTQVESLQARIVAIIAKSGKRFSNPEEIKAALDAEGPAVSLAKVRRTLKDLQSFGMVKHEYSLTPYAEREFGHEVR